MTTTQGHAVPEFTVADRLRKARETAGLDQSEFAARAEISRTTIINYEHGRRVPRAVYLRAWSIASGVDLRWLTTGHADDGDRGVSGAPVAA
jgi:transcriptional regulator with XRE-family HTH domain